MVTNHHVMKNARADIEKRCWMDPVSDICILPLDACYRGNSDRHPFPVATIANASVTNGTLEQQVLRILGVGADLFALTGRPVDYSSNMGAPGLRRYHALITPRNALIDASEIQGMSGSPVYIEGTKEIVGVVTRVGFSENDKEGDWVTDHCSVIFVGINDVRAAIKGYIQAQSNKR